MSHSTVLVIVRQADSVEEAEAKAEELLAPWDENLDIPHEEWGETPTSVLDEALWWRGARDKDVEAKYEAKHPEPDKARAKDWELWARRVIAEYHGGTPHEVLWDPIKGWGYVSHYNPKSKWDWYMLGGRWTGFWPLKDLARGKTGEPGIMTERAEPGWADLARKDEIDFDFKRRQAIIEAEARFNTWQTSVDSVPDDQRAYTSWKDTRDKYPGNIESARSEYRAQPIMKAMREAKLGLWDDPDTYFYGQDDARERYVKAAEGSAFSTFAVLDGGDWYEQGHIGWWGIVSDEKDQGEWNEQFTKLLDGLDDTAWLAVYDVHI